MARYEVIVTDDRFGSYKEEENILKEINAKLTVYNLKSEEDAIYTLSKADAVLVNLFDVTKRIIKSMKRCKIISRYGVGFDNVDVEAATKKGIWVARVPDYCIEEASDHALALLLACIRKITYKDKKIREGKWNLHRSRSVQRISGRSLGLIGYGKVARNLHRNIMGMKLSNVFVYDPYVDQRFIISNGGVPVDLNELFIRSDYISLHVPYTKETHYMIGEKEIALMKPNVILINTSRGSVLDEKAVINALKNKRINSAGLDVFEKEPIPKNSALLYMDNVILSDHAAYYSEESLIELKTKAAKNVLEVLNGNKPVYPVNEVLVPNYV